MASSPKAESAKSGAAQGSRRLARLEWLVAALSTLVVIGLVGALLMEATSGSNSPPKLSISLKPPVAEGQNVHFRFTVSNEGGRTAAAVGVALIVGRSRASRRVTIDYVPPHSEVSGGFYVGAEEMSPGLVPVIEGYVDP